AGSAAGLAPAGEGAAPRELAEPAPARPAAAGEPRRLQPRPETGTRYVAAEVPTQRRMAELWQEMMGFGPIGVHDDFFSLGGHSLMATQLIARVRAEFGVEVSLDAVFDDPTVAGMADKVAALRGGAEVEPPPTIPRVPRDGPLPLSFHQERLWALDRIEPGSPLYNVPVGSWARGPLDVDAAQRALAEIVRRHEVYRTMYVETDAGPAQVVLPRIDVPLPVDDLAAVPEAERLATASRLLTEESRRPFDLDTGPLMRARLLRFEDELHVLLSTTHHIIMDGWSGGIFFYEWGVLYEAFVAGKPSPLPELPIGYADYAVWQREQLSGERLERHLAFWRESLRGVPPTLELPTDRPYPPVQSYRGGLRGIELDDERMDRIRALAQDRRTTLHVVMAAAFQALCFRYTGQEDFAVGSLAANRRAETLGIIGFFINTIPIRARPSARLRFDELLEQARSWMAASYGHAEVPLQMILDEVRPERDPSRNPLIQVMLGIQAPGDHGPPPEDHSGLTLHRLGDGVVPTGDSGTSKFDLSILVDEGESPTAVAEYNSDLFDPATVDRFLEHFRMLLDAVTAAPETPLAEIPLLVEGERRQLLEEWSSPAALPPERRSLPAAFAAQAARTPDAAAVVLGTERVTYAALQARAGRVAAMLRAAGVGPESRVGVLLERTPELVAVLLGVLEAGAAYVPLDPAYPQGRLALMLEDSGAVAVVTQDSLAGRLPPTSAVVLRVDGSEENDSEEYSVLRTSFPENLAYVIYTSGTTGRPKGVAVTHGSVLALVRWAEEEFTPRELSGVLASTSVCFDLSVFEIFVPLCLGGTTVLAGSALELAEAAADEVTLVNTVPTAMAELVRAGELPPGVRAVNLAGEALPPRLAAEVHARGGVRLRNLYGPTEDTVYSTCARIPAGAAAVSIGRPVAGTRAYVLDGELNPAPSGVPGALYLAGEGLARGYLGRPELSAERFVPCPFGEPGGRMYATGDRVRWLASGELDFLGRVDHQVKLRGFRIEPGEIESVLLRDPGVRECVVVVRADAAGERRLVAYLAGAGLPDPEALRTRLRESLPEYMVPSAFVALDSVPLTPNGKVDRAALPVPEAARADGREHAAPRTPAEQVLAEVWSAVLGVERVGIHDRFFELGGDSILAIRVATGARRAGLKLLPRQLFEHATIAELARVVGTGAAVAAPVTSGEAAVTGPVPLTPIQRAFFARDDVARHHFNHGMLLVPSRALDPRLLDRALAALVAHHDALRLRFLRGGGGWTQLHAPAGVRVPLAAIDLSRLDEAARTAALAAAVDRVHASLELERGPIARAVHFHLGGGGPGRLLLVLHHLVVDGVSWRILLEDLESAYVQLERGEPVRLPPKTTSWKAWAERLVEQAYAPATAAELPYWSAQAHSVVAPLPLDDPAGEDTVGRARSAVVHLDAEETEALLRDVPAAYRTHIDEVLLCALALALGRWTGERRVRVDLEGHGREE
ncbi:MAG: amino acid adenylation domain-containing protein, partial [Longimicrobiaceae bacterium]